MRRASRRLSNSQFGTGLVYKLHELQQGLSLLSSHPLLALAEAADMMGHNLGCDCVAILAYDEEDPDCALLLASHGCAAALEGMTVMQGPAWSAARLRAAEPQTAAAAAAAGAARVYVPDAASLPPGFDLPEDFARLYSKAGLRSFLSVAIGARGQPYGALLLGRRQPGAWDDPWSSVWPAAAATTLLQHLRPAAVPQVCAAVRAVGAAPDAVAAISALLESGADFMEHSTNITMGVRLALLLPDDPSSALVFEPLRAAGGGQPAGGALGRVPRARSSASTASSASSAAGLGEDEGRPPAVHADVAVRELPLANTLLSSTVTMGMARFIRDCSAYLRSCPNPVRDVFTHASRLVSSVVVVPLVVAGAGGCPPGAGAGWGDGGGSGSGGGGEGGTRAIGAVYFTQDRPCHDFSNIQDALVGFVQCVGPALHRRVAGHIGQLADLASMAAARRLGDCSVDSSMTGPPPGWPGCAPADAAGAAAAAATAAAVIAMRPLSSEDGSMDAVAAPGRGAPGPCGGSPSKAPPAGGPGTPTRAGALHPAGGAAFGGGASFVSRYPSSASGSEGGAATGPGAFDSGGGGLPAAQRLAAVSSKRLCTEAMLQMLQQDIRRGRRRSIELSAAVAELTITKPLGQGGFGLVYRGTWHRMPAAIKVMDARRSNSEALSDAMEMAVLSCVQHPGIVQVFSCLTDMVLIDPDTGGSTTEGSTGGSSASSAASGRRRRASRVQFRRTLPCDEGADVPTCNVVIMELCDRGSLRDAVRKGAFHRRMEGGVIGVDLGAMLDVLLDVASSLAYLHRINLLHGDVKLDNVLLKTDPSRPLGVAPKLADFGLTKMLRDDESVLNHTGAGTVTHLAPEMFVSGSRVTSAVDVYAFGVLLYEFYTGKQAFAGWTKEMIIDGAGRRGVRPAFPAGTPIAFADLAAACWAPRPEARPSFPEVSAALQAMASGLASELSIAGAGAGAASAAGNPAALGAPCSLAAAPAAAAQRLPQQA